MAATYSELKTEIAGLLHRSDLTASIAGFISRAEARINRAVKPRAAETEATLTGVVSSRFIALPSGFNGAIALWIEQDGERDALQNRLPEDLDITSSNGTPCDWAIDGTNVAFDKPCESADTFYLRYFAKFALSDAAPTNWMLTNVPDLYLYASMIEASMFIRDDKWIAAWTQSYTEIIKDLKDSEHQNKSLAPLRTELPGTARRANILQG